MKILSKRENSPKTIKNILRRIKNTIENDLRKIVSASNFNLLQRECQTGWISEWFQDMTQLNPACTIAKNIRCMGVHDTKWEYIAITKK